MRNAVCETEDMSESYWLRLKIHSLWSRLHALRLLVQLWIVDGHNCAIVLHYWYIVRQMLYLYMHMPCKFALKFWLCTAWHACCAAILCADASYVQIAFNVWYKLCNHVSTERILCLCFV